MPALCGGCQVRPNKGRQALDGGHLGHFAEIGPPAMLTSMAGARAREGAQHLHKARLLADCEPEVAKIRGKCRATRSERDLGQKPECMEEGLVGRGALKTSLSGVGRSCRYDVDAGAEA